MQSLHLTFTAVHVDGEFVLSLAFLMTTNMILDDDQINENIGVTSHNDMILTIGHDVVYNVACNLAY